MSNYGNPSSATEPTAAAINRESKAINVETSFELTQNDDIDPTIQWLLASILQVSDELSSLRKHFTTNDQMADPLHKWAPYQFYAHLRTATDALDHAVHDAKMLAKKNPSSLTIPRQYVYMARELSTTVSAATSFGLGLLNRKIAEYQVGSDGPERAGSSHALDDGVVLEIGRFNECSALAAGSVWAALDVLQQAYQANLATEEYKGIKEVGGSVVTKCIVYEIVAEDRQVTGVKSDDGVCANRLPTDWMVVVCVLCCICCVFFAALEEYRYPLRFPSH